MTPTIYIDGRFVPEQEARVSVYDGAFLHGAGLFETLRTQNGRVFRLEAHLDRLRKSASRILAPIEREQLPSAAVFRELLDRNSLTAARVRLTVSCGVVKEGGAERREALTVCLTASPLSTYPKELYESGVRVAVSDFRVSTTDPIAGHKTTAYLPRLLGLRFAQEKRCLEAIAFNTRNQLAEGSISNVFVVRDGVVKTPPIDTPVLPGITRGIVLDLARRLGIGVEETSLGIDDLLDADEVFLTNAIMRVMPVIRVEKHDIAKGRPGSISRRLGDAYADLVSEECG